MADNCKTDLKIQNDRMAWAAFVWVRTDTRRILLRARWRTTCVD